MRFGGPTMGTTYQVNYVSIGAPVDQKAIEALLADITQSMSTYLETSTISAINASEDISAWHPIDRHFETVFKRSVEIHADTKGAFNPAIGPLVNAWGFGPDGPRDLPSDAEVRSLLELVKLDAFEMRAEPPAIRKRLPGARLDFNAIAEGYAADAVGSLLEREGVRDYLVDIGGEVRGRGKNDEGRPWQVGIERPSADKTAPAPIQVVAQLKDAGMATSGNYRNYRIGADGQRLSHILNPATGLPERSSLLSVAVIAEDAMTADAYGTALMVMGLDEGMRFVEAHHELQAYFIASDGGSGFVERHSMGFPLLY